MPFTSRQPAAGQQLPDLPVTLLDGQTSTLCAGPRTLLLVIDLRCTACRDGLAILATKVRAVAAELRVLALNWGDEPVAREVAAAFGPAVAVSVQPDTRLLKRLGLVHAPSAVLIDATGTVLVETAIGTAAIAALLESVTEPAAVGLDR